MKWYTAQVLTGEELLVRSRLLDKGVAARVPQEARPIHRRGAWRLETYRLFPGYVFVGAQMLTDALYYQVKAVPGVIRLLGVGKPQPLTEDEAAYLELLAPTPAPLPPSEARIGADGKVHIVNGVLASPRIQLLKVNLHARRAKVKIPMLHKDKTVWLGIYMEEDGQDEEKICLQEKDRASAQETPPSPGAAHALQTLFLGREGRHQNRLSLCPLRYGYGMGQSLQKVLAFKKSRLRCRLIRPDCVRRATKREKLSEQLC